MQRVNGNPYTGALQFPAGRYVAFAIAPESDYDQVRIDGRLLVAGRVLQLETPNPKITAVRGPRSRPSDAFPGAAYEVAVIGYQCGDVIAPAGPRAPRVFRKFQGTLTGTHSLRVPFVGRRHAVIRFPVVKTITLEYYVLGIRYTDDDTLAAYTGEQQFAASLLGTVGAPIVAALTADDANGYHISVGRHIGGADSAEYADELAISFVSTLGGPLSSDVVVEVEVAGEQGMT